MLEVRREPVMSDQLELAEQGHEEGRRPAEHDDSGGTFNGAQYSPLVRHEQVAVANGRIGDGRKIKRLLEMAEGSKLQVQQRVEPDFQRMNRENPDRRRQ